MANLFTGLPHVIGSISNLSGNQVKRAMVSIKSENRRRQKVFSDYGVNNISAYMSLYKSGDAKEPIPHMLIIIDEFAELKREEPDFMRELVSVAQVGRSLGVHLILATQKPAGTVDDNIWSNSKFKLCLRVQDRQDSMDMLHRSDAAYLIQAGRGFLQVGNDELFELFQSGYSGVTYDQELGDQDLVVAQILDNVGRVDLVGNYFRIQYQEKARKNWMTLLYESVVEAMGGVFRGHRVDETLIGSEDFMVAVYEGIQRRGSEYERSRYNDIRLQEFMRLFALLPEGLGGDASEAIMRMAKERGVRPPEARKQTQLEAVIQYLKQVAVENNYTHSINLWMPVLPDHILLTEIEGYHDFDLCKKHESSVWELSAVIGKGDDPENQSQMPIRIDFAANGHHAVCGMVTTGKSTLLQTTIYALVNQYSSAELNLYLLDFSVKLLSVFDGCKQVGGIMTDGEEDVEKISKFFTMLSAIMDERKRLLASTNFRDYVEYGGNALPAIVIAIDNFAAFREKTNDQYEDKIRLVAKEGINYGIFLLVTAGGFGSAEIPIRLADNFRTTICLEMSDVYQYGDVMRVVKPPVYPEPNTKGRGLVYYGGKIVEFQTALACPGKNVFERNKNIRKRVEKINAVNTQKPAKRIPAIPEKAMWEEYAAQDDYKALIADNRRLPSGYDAVTAAYASIDLAKTLTYVVGGTKKSGKSAYMKALIQAAVDKSSEVCIIEVDSKEFEQIATKTGARYVTNSQGIYDYAKNVLLPAAGERADHKVECLSQHLDDDEFFEAMLSYKRHCVFIANLPKFLESLYDRESDAYDAVSVYETLVGDKGYHYNFYFFLELGDNEIAEVSGYGFMRSFRDNGTGICFGGKYLNQKFLPYANIPYKLQSAPLKPGTGVLACDDESVSVEQVVVPYYKG